MNLSAIILAAGASRRMGRDKLALPCGGGTVLQCAVRPYLGQEGIGEVLVVVQPGQRRALPAGVRPVPAARWAQGMGASLAAGVAAAHPDADGYLVGLGDLPHLQPAVVRALVDAFRHAGQGVVVPCHAGRRGHPVILAPRHRQALLALEGDVGGRRLIAGLAQDVLELEVGTDAIFRDVDTPADL